MITNLVRRTTADPILDYRAAAFLTALAVVAERIRELPPADKRDLLEMTTALIAAESLEDEQAAIAGILEIVDPPAGGVRELPLPEQTSVELQAWMTQIGGKIKHAREAAGLTQEQLAAASGLQQSHICRLETGVHSPSHKTVEKIAAALGKPATDFDPSATEDDADE